MQIQLDFFHSYMAEYPPMQKEFVKIWTVAGRFG